jgi:hypothetical protein
MSSPFQEGNGTKGWECETEHIIISMVIFIVLIPQIFSPVFPDQSSSPHPADLPYLGWRTSIAPSTTLLTNICLVGINSLDYLEIKYSEL